MSPFRVTAPWKGSATQRGETEDTRSQVEPPQDRSGASAPRHRHGRDLSPLRLPKSMDGPAPPVSVPPPAALGEVRLNGFPGTLAEVLRHRVGGGGRRVSDAAPRGFSDARFVIQPAYPPWPHSVCLPEGLAGGCAPSDPRNGNGAA